jgi:hypothetical protein
VSGHGPCSPFSRTALAAIPLVLGLSVISLAAIALRDTYWGDPTTYLVYARNAAAGHPFSWDPFGGFSSGAASPLWGLVLAVPFTIGAGVAGAKLWVAIWVAIALALTVAVAARESRSLLPAGIAAFFVVGSLTFYGVMLYDSSLVVAISALSIAACRRVAESPPAERLPPRVLLSLAAVWASLPLARPDGVLLAVIELSALSLFAARGRALQLVMVGAIAAIPAAAYYGYSKLTLGSFVVSTDTRQIDQLQAASYVGGIAYSWPAIAYLGTIAVPLILVAAGIVYLWTRPDSRWLAISASAAIVAYTALLVLYPVTFYMERYFLPVSPFIVVVITRTLRRAFEPSTIAKAVAALGIVFLAAMLPWPLETADAESMKGYTLDEITEREAAEKINAIAPSGATVMTYELDARLPLRDDLRTLAVNGLTDGKVAPYRQSKDMRAFLLRYRPWVWIANDVVGRLPYTTGTLLHSAEAALVADPHLQTLSLEGIRFDVIARRERAIPDGFAGWRLILRLTYPP